jgi:DNA-binding MarR family transcriptional regulator
MWSVIDRAVVAVPAAIDNLDVHALELCLTLRTAGNVMMYDLRDHLAGHTAISGSALNMLLLAQLHGELEFSRLAKFAGMKKATASRLIDSMVGEGLLARRYPADDRRTVLLSATPEGHRIWAECAAVYNEREKFWASGLSDAEQATLITLLRKMVDARIEQSAVCES